MAIDYKTGQAPKGPSNSNQMASTSGTQQTALQNVGGLNLNPSMPAGPQIQKQQRSSFQQSVTPPAPGQGPKPSPAVARQRMPAGQPVVSRGMPMDQGRGYNVFSGMDAGQISDMNRTMGMSNLTALPNMTSVAPLKAPMYDPGLVASEGPIERQLMYNSGESPDELYYDYMLNGGDMTKEEWDSLTYGQQKNYHSGAKQAPNQLALAVKEAEIEAGQDQQQAMSEYEDPYLEAVEGSPDPSTYTDDLYEFYEDPYPGVEEQMDEKYALQLQSVLAGLDRQAAMMGMLGSPAHTNMINTAISGVLETMAAEYADLSVLEQDKKMELLDKIREAEDAEAAFMYDVQAGVDLATNMFADSALRVEQLPTANQRLGFTDYLTTINNQFQKEYMSATNAEARQSIYLKYASINADFMNLIRSYVQREDEGTVNFKLNQIYEAIGLGSDYPADFGITIKY